MYAVREQHEGKPNGLEDPRHSGVWNQGGLHPPTKRRLSELMAKAVRVAASNTAGELACHANAGWRYSSAAYGSHNTPRSHNQK